MMPARAALVGFTFFSLTGPSGSSSGWAAIPRGEDGHLVDYAGGVMALVAVGMACRRCPAGRSGDFLPSMVAGVGNPGPA